MMPMICNVAQMYMTFLYPSRSTIGSNTIVPSSLPTHVTVTAVGEGRLGEIRLTRVHDGLAFGIKNIFPFLKLSKRAKP